jgi:hypothetical protein
MKFPKSAALPPLHASLDVRNPSKGTRSQKLLKEAEFSLLANYGPLLRAAAKRERAAKWRSHRLKALMGNRRRLGALLGAEVKLWLIDKQRSPRHDKWPDKDQDTSVDAPKIVWSIIGECGELSSISVKVPQSSNSEMYVRKLAEAETWQSFSRPSVAETSLVDLEKCKTTLTTLPRVVRLTKTVTPSVGGEEVCESCLDTVERVAVRNAEAGRNLSRSGHYLQRVMSSNESVPRIASRLLDGKLCILEGASVSILLDSAVNFLEQCFVLRRHILLGAIEQQELLLTMLAEVGRKPRCTAQQAFSRALDWTSWTRNEGARRLWYSKMTIGDVDKELLTCVPGYRPPCSLGSLFGGLSVYAVLHKRLLRSAHIAALLRQVHNRHRYYTSNTVLDSQTIRRVECFKHELRFVVNAFIAYDQHCIERIWQSLLRDLDMSNPRAIVQTHHRYMTNLAHHCGLNDPSFDIKASNVLQVATNSKDVSSRHINKARNNFLAVLNDLVLMLSMAANPTDIKIDLLNRLNTVIRSTSKWRL